ncbi:MAG: rhamnogalacturonan lyase [Acidobacteria bacterium]|nr:rhamnogalacturonan lyase [Acidobacteriota bacterium]MBI3426411.1 rhamnogalacturonan lyase [Acidobacteriota bacterium]
MKKMTSFQIARIVAVVSVMLGTQTFAQRQMENLGRGVVAVRQPENKVWVGWRLLGLDAENIAFNLYRSTAGGTPVKLNAQPITAATNWIDDKADLTKANAYFVRPVRNGKEQAASATFTLPANAPVRQYLAIPLQTPTGYAPNDASVGDLDGDGEYEIVLHQAGRGRDNSQAGLTDPPILQAYKLDGTLLWTINLGKNIREGAHYTQFMVYDLDGDGRAEIACKTADGTVDGKGKVIGDANADWRNPEGTFLTSLDRNGVERKQNVTGYVLKGPEYLTIFDGLTGAALATTAFIPPRHPTKTDPTADQLKAVWGDGYGNRVDRFLAAIAYLDGKQPSLVMCRGYYTRSVLTAWNWRGGKLSKVWTFDSDDGTPGNKAFAGQGNHNLSVGDVDGDGKDEIVYGAMVIDDNGKGLYSTGLGHGDALHLSDLDPTRPGLEVFDIQERFDDAGAHFRDARTGEILWKKPSIKAGADGEGPGRGLALDIDPRYPGSECWVKGAGVTGLFSAKGEKIAEREPRSCNFGVWWDGDVLRELLDRNVITKWNWLDGTETTLLTAEGCTSNNGTKATPALSADLFGDWREEVIWRTTDNKELRIYTTTIPTPHRFYTLMHDPQYRLSIAWQNVAYNQPPHTGFHLGEGMKPPPRPAIVVKGKR